jgi:NADPH:quinone reductase-like Zn-dependent oxidoreductase
VIEAKEGPVQAAIRERYGSADVIELRDIERPVPKDDEILVRVRAASVNRADLDGLKPRPGFVRLFMGVRRPRDKRIGIDVAGEVEAVGGGVTRFAVGDRVFADLFSHGQGAFAEYVSAAEKAFLPIPATMSYDVAATLPHSAILAIQGLRSRGGQTIRASDRVLIDGASGNVGPFAVQIAKALGADVTATCRTEKIDFVRSLGADHVIDFTAVDYTKEPERYDWILDTDSHHPILGCRRALRPHGRYVTLGAGSLATFAALLATTVASRPTARKAGLMLWWRPFDAQDIGTISGLIEGGKLVPAIDRRYPLSDVAEALRHVDEGRSRGKVLVIP